MRLVVLQIDQNVVLNDFKETTTKLTGFYTTSFKFNFNYTTVLLFRPLFEQPRCTWSYFLAMPLAL